MRTREALAGGVLVVVGLASTGGVAVTRTAVPRQRCGGRRATIVGTAHADVITGMARADVIAGLGGGDTILGRGGNDVICGGAGDDIILGGSGSGSGSGSDRAVGGAGFDTCRGDEHLTSCEETRLGIPANGVPMPAGTHVGDFLRPRIAFTLDTGWRSEGETPVRIDLVHGTQTGVDPDLWIDSSSASSSVEAVVAAIAAVPELRARPAASASVGGAPGERLEISADPSLPVREVGVPGLAEGYSLFPGDRARLDVVSVGGRTVVVVYAAAASLFDGGLGVVDGVLSSVRWSG